MHLNFQAWKKMAMEKTEWRRGGSVFFLPFLHGGMRSSILSDS